MPGQSGQRRDRHIHPHHDVPALQTARRDPAAVRLRELARPGTCRLRPLDGAGSPGERAEVGGDPGLMPADPCRAHRGSSHARRDQHQPDSQDENRGGTSIPRPMPLPPPATVNGPASRRPHPARPRPVIRRSAVIPHRAAGRPRPAGRGIGWRTEAALRPVEGWIIAGRRKPAHARRSPATEHRAEASTGRPLLLATGHHGSPPRSSGSWAATAVARTVINGRLPPSTRT